MSMTDPIADMLTRIRNAQSKKFHTVKVFGSKATKAILDVLKSEGYIRSYTADIGPRGEKMLNVELKYDGSIPVITKIQRVSKPGCRVYSSIDLLPKVMNGLGIAILSTSQGIMSDSQARQIRSGGEVICHVC